MVGISFFKKADAQILKTAIAEAYEKGGYEDLFWDDVVNDNLYRLDLTVHPVNDKDITEIDSEAELKLIDPDYIKYNE